MCIDGDWLLFEARWVDCSAWETRSRLLIFLLLLAYSVDINICCCQTKRFILICFPVSYVSFYMSNVASSSMHVPLIVGFSMLGTASCVTWCLYCDWKVHFTWKSEYKFMSFCCRHIGQVAFIYSLLFRSVLAREVLVTSSGCIFL